MPLPIGGVWPPEELSPARDKWASWSAWYSGDPDQLSSVYGGQVGIPGTTSGQFYANQAGSARLGAVQRFARWFWSAAPAVGEQRTKLHVPIASVVANLSADLLFADDVDIKAVKAKATVDGPAPKDVGSTDTPAKPSPEPKPDAKTQERIDYYQDQGLATKLREAAEICAAMGGVYLRNVWDETVADAPWIDAVQPEAAVPEWRYGKLTAVTFWRVISCDQHTYVRHLERHEVGKILHGVYVGSKEELGHRVPLTEYAETAGIAEVLDAGDEIQTGIDMLTASYIPNILPNRIWRSNAALVHFGRSDFDGVEGLMDALDECYSSWMRDIRLGKARIIVDQNALDTRGKGQGASMDLDKELFVGMSLGPEPLPSALITQSQFNIRVAEHDQTARALTEQILQACGYSSQAESEDNSGPVTATQVSARKERSLSTRDRKINYWGPAIRDRVQANLKLDNIIFGAGVKEDPPTVEFSDGVAEDPKDVAQTLVFLNTAQAVSEYTKIKMVHPDWDDEQIQEEQDRIAGETAEKNQALIDAMPDPVAPSGPKAPTITKKTGAAGK